MQNNSIDTVQNQMQQPLAVSIPEAARMVGICPKTMYQLAASDGFPAVRLGKRLVVPVDRLRDWLDRQAVGC